MLLNQLDLRQKSSIQAIRASARSLPNFERFRTRVLFHCGKLQLMPA